MTVAGGHRPVLQVVKFGTITNAQGLTRDKLWLSDGDRWVLAMAVPQEGRVLTPGCFVRLIKSTKARSRFIHDMEIVALPQPLIKHADSLP